MFRSAMQPGRKTRRWRTCAGWTLRVKLLSLFARRAGRSRRRIDRAAAAAGKERRRCRKLACSGMTRPRPPVRLGTINIDRGTVRYRDPALRADVSVKLQSTPAAAGHACFASLFRRRHACAASRSTSTARVSAFPRCARSAIPISSPCTRGRERPTCASPAASCLPRSSMSRASFSLQGKDLSQLYPIVPLPIPWTPPYKLSGQLAHGEGSLVLSAVQGNGGRQRPRRRFRRRSVRRSRPSFTAELSSRRFNYKDLGGFVGLPPGDATSGVENRRAAAGHGASRGSRRACCRTSLSSSSACASPTPTSSFAEPASRGPTRRSTTCRRTCF